MTEQRKWEEGMGEISGFGGTYEEACRNMVLAGVKYLDVNPSSNPEFRGLAGVFGVVDANNEDAESLLDHMVPAAGDDPTGAMVHACVLQVLYVKANGWDAYVKARKGGA